MYLLDFKGKASPYFSSWEDTMDSKSLAAFQDRFMKDIGDHPERAKNLHFSFVVLLRAVRKASVWIFFGDFHRKDVMFFLQFCKLSTSSKYSKLFRNCPEVIRTTTCFFLNVLIQRAVCVFASVVFGFGLVKTKTVHHMCCPPIWMLNAHVFIHQYRKFVATTGKFVCPTSPVSGSTVSAELCFPHRG